MNCRHFRKRLNMICDFIPSLTFLFCMFGFLVLRIIHKWFNYTSLESTKAPSLLIGQFLSFFFVLFHVSAKIAFERFVMRQPIEYQISAQATYCQIQQISVTSIKHDVGSFTAPARLQQVAFLLRCFLHCVS